MSTFSQQEEQRRTGFGQALVPTRVLRPPANVYSPWTTQQVFSFFGSLTNVAEVATFQFFVLAGAGAPTITAGFVKLNVVDRPQRKGFTVPAGYDPITMDVPVQFEALVAQPAGKFAITKSVEYDIQQLEWMAGRGKLFATAADKGVGAPATGDPPIVLVASFDAHGNETNLIPPNLHGVKWLVSSINYDTNPYRSANGDRVRQAATVTLTEFVASAGSTLDSPTTRAKARNAQTASHVTRYTRSGDTIRKMTERYTAYPATFSAMQSVLNANKAKLKVKSIDQVLKPGTAVLIPTVLLIPS